MKFAAIFILLLMTTIVQAQSKAIVLDGVVRYGGVAIPGATVTIKNGEQTISAISGANGGFHLEGASEGIPYAVEAARFGYLNYEREETITLGNKGYDHIVIDLMRGFNDDAELDQGWQFGVEGDNATAGVWARAIPQGTMVNGKLAEPNQDATAEGSYCYVTGAGDANTEPNESDVDGGKTTLRSPLFSLAEINQPVLHFSYWFSNDLGSNHGGDFFRAQISNDGGATWINLINTAASTRAWKPVSVTIADFVSPTDQMLLQFVADDDGLGSLVEAAVDDISFVGAPNVPEPPRDLLLDVQFDQIVLTWKGSSDVSGYRVYLSQYPNDVVKPEHLLTTTPDTTLTVPLTEIPYNEFYFQVTAIR
jgi:hypothetical protein